MRFLKVELGCPNCGCFWMSPTVLIYRPNETWDAKHTQTTCKLCGAEGEASGDGITAMVDAMEATEN
jgi:hypothetical protein